MAIYTNILRAVYGSKKTAFWPLRNGQVVTNKEQRSSYLVKNEFVINRKGFFLHFVDIPSILIFAERFGLKV
ncbi:1095_t:CDS:2 [Ambispora gerdemannii]|uniref:1095_t:CDS:1 n=1 Tax=Ambispora gerdemannii TaxID=144530 RepID=A0A9N8W1P3_9GLOM|nr:1095_t:CDS:2 [Ambispora gerdemannii]